MNVKERTYVAIDLKSFYASVECVERKLDPLTTKLVVADSSRTNKTICLAVTPALKKYGLSGRSRLFEVEQKAAEIKRQSGKDFEYIIAPPRMALYIEYSAKIYGIYLSFFSAEDIHVYSIDEVFIDVTSYIKYYKVSARELTRMVIARILSETGITATAGIAENLYLCKIAMDIVAKHVEADSDGVRIAELNEMLYRKLLWNHKPITDFWRIGKGISERLARNCMFTMGDIARRSLIDEERLYKIFGVDAEILIDHAWGYEPCTIKDIKSYRSQAHSLGSGQVLQKPYSYEMGKIIVREMAEQLSMDMFRKGVVASCFTLNVCYERFENNNENYSGPIVFDWQGHKMAKPAHGSKGVGEATNSIKVVTDAFLEIYEQSVNPELYVRRFNLTANNIVPMEWLQPALFENPNHDEKEDKLQMARLKIMEKFGKNAILKGTDFEDGAMTRERNGQIGGHRA